MKKETNIGVVIQLFIANKKEKIRQSNEQITVDENGILGDKFYDKKQDRAILLSSIISYDILKNENIDVLYGQLGENVLVDFNPYDLDIGTKLAIGTSILEITGDCTICKLLKKIDDKVPKLIKNDRGVFAKVIKSGTININDSISIIN